MFVWTVYKCSVDRCFVCILDTPRYPGMVSELDCWMEWIENQMAEEPYDNPVDDEMDDFIGGMYLHTVELGPVLLNQ